jgi:hypothetical protein
MTEEINIKKILNNRIFEEEWPILEQIKYYICYFSKALN